ncbi:helix-turn-helix domain-containing protein [Bacillus cereus]|uniref:helix-turn-helix domain-containing protein n=1 Tax=Bacillus cereus TaxID=1396 RepID=UPI003A7FB8C1
MERRMLVGVSLLFCILLRRMLENEMQSMLINKEYRIRIYLNKRQEFLITKTISCSRFLFKRLHTMWNNTYKEIEKR